MLECPAQQWQCGEYIRKILTVHLTFHDAGLNTGTVIIRNSDWSRMLVEDMATYGKYPVDWSKEATLRAAVPTYDMGMYEQNVLIYRITSDSRMLEKESRCLPPCCCVVPANWTSLGCSHLFMAAMSYFICSHMQSILQKAFHALLQMRRSPCIL